MIVAMLLVRLSSRGPAIYTQRRLGLGGKVFTIYKIRTMYQDSERHSGATWSLPGDPRVTPVGRVLRFTHLDELPQLINVLLGEMSLVGPRPERPEFLPKLERALPDYRRRLAVRPGVTGLAQVQQPPDSDLGSVRRKLNYDLYYADHITLWLDVRIVLATGLKCVGVPFAWIGRADDAAGSQLESRIPSAAPSPCCARPSWLRSRSCSLAPAILGDFEHFRGESDEKAEPGIPGDPGRGPGPLGRGPAPGPRHPVASQRVEAAGPAHRAEADKKPAEAEDALRWYLSLRPDDGPTWAWYARLVDRRDAEPHAPGKGLPAVSAGPPRRARRPRAQAGRGRSGDRAGAPRRCP